MSPEQPSPVGKEGCACLLSRFSPIRLFAIPWTVDLQAPLSMRFSRQEILGCHALLQGIFPTPGMTVRRERMSNFLGNGRLHRNLEAGALMTGLCRLMPVLAAPSHWVAGSSEAAENEEWKCWSLSGV